MPQSKTLEMEPVFKEKSIKLIKSLLNDDEKKPPFLKKEIQAFLHALGTHPELFGLCQLPNSVLLSQGIESISHGLATIYQQGVINFLAQHAYIFKHQPFITGLGLLWNYKPELCFLDHLAYRCMGSVDTVSSDESFKYMTNVIPFQNDEFMSGLMQLGFIQQDDLNSKSEQLRFIHPAFQQFFAARYLAACLQKAVEIEPSQKYPKRVDRYDVQHHQWQDNALSLEEFIKQQVLNEDNARIWLFVADLLKNNAAAYHHFMFVLLQVAKESLSLKVAQLVDEMAMLIDLKIKAKKLEQDAFADDASEERTLALLSELDGITAEIKRLGFDSGENSSPAQPSVISASTLPPGMAALLAASMASRTGPLASYSSPDLVTSPALVAPPDVPENKEAVVSVQNNIIWV